MLCQAASAARGGQGLHLRKRAAHAVVVALSAPSAIQYAAGRRIPFVPCRIAPAQFRPGSDKLPGQTFATALEGYLLHHVEGMAASFIATAQTPRTSLDRSRLGLPRSGHCQPQRMRRAYIRAPG
jgi:hypothetical protein